jgi:hypothetical protein
MKALLAVILPTVLGRVNAGFVVSASRSSSGTSEFGAFTSRFAR